MDLHDPTYQGRRATRPLVSFLDTRACHAIQGGLLSVSIGAAVRAPPRGGRRSARDPGSWTRRRARDPDRRRRRPPAARFPSDRRRRTPALFCFADRAAARGRPSWRLPSFPGDGRAVSSHGVPDGRVARPNPISPVRMLPFRHASPPCHFRRLCSAKGSAIRVRHARTRRKAQPRPT